MISCQDGSALPIIIFVIVTKIMLILELLLLMLSLLFHHHCRPHPRHHEILVRWSIISRGKLPQSAVTIRS